MWIPLVVLAAVFVLVAVRRIGKFRLEIWQIMGAGALAVLLTLQIDLFDAALAIDLDVMLFLLGMFIVGHALEVSGYLAHISHRLFRRARTTDQLVLLLLFGLGASSALLMNDTLAIIGTPVVLSLAKVHKLPPKMMLLALAFAITIGSIASPIGNPQNLLVAVDGGVPGPFATFAYYLAVPTVLSLLVAYVVLRLFFRREFGKKIEPRRPGPLADPRLALLCKVSLAVISVLIALRVGLTFVGTGTEFRLTYIALAGAAPIVLASSRRAEILKGVDWRTLVFFAAMFVLMRSVWDTGFFQVTVGGQAGNNESILGVSILLSQLTSNVPLVALYLPVLLHLGVSTEGLMALAAGSTLAGNLFILGAASNVIIIQNAEKRGATLKFLEFAKVGAPLTLLSVMVYYAYFLLV